ncbi:uncharacterized protein LOC116159174 [Photinus pyralis]|uniref:Uncharacterized protein n=1 Tax=Photinus pyralis TaxID=7054 RepID=A0A1Y1LFT5_PHOPY|nr:uncharacterized protein LOC116159174 [Photinus pyralis]
MIAVRRQPFRDKSNTKTKANIKVPFEKLAIPKKHKKVEQKQLRNKKVNNYKELSILDNSASEQSTNIQTHIPIYLQNATPQKRLKNKDPFEFVDSGPKKQKKEDGSDSDSTIYDRSMQEILRGIRNREKKEKNKKQRKKVKLKTKPPHLENTEANLSIPITNRPQANVPAIALPTSTPVPQSNATSNINIISIIEIPARHRTPSPLSSVDGNYSPEWNYELKDETTQPWRGDHLNLRRNPHWLLLKDSSLPNYNQEMILEPELIEKFPTPKPMSKEKPLVQTKISNYVESAPKIIEISNVSSLFDDHSFSPLKNEPSQRLPFSPITDDVLNSKRRLELDSCFGFNFDENDKENMSPVRRSSRKLPMRVSPREVKKVRKEIVEQLIPDVSKDVTNVSIPAENNESVHLFEDLKDETPVQKTYAAKRRKKRIVSITEDEDKPKKKRKDLKTQAEEEEFNKWAANFNAMCDEVEQHSLEIT